MFIATAEEKVPLEAKKEPFMVCGFLGLFWNFCYGPEDHLGSTRMVLKAQNDGSSTVEQALMYQPYGTVSDVAGITSPKNDPLRDKFTTKEFDEDGQLDVGLIEFNIALNFALTHTDPDKPNRVEVYYADALANPEIINITIDPSNDNGKVNAVLKNATARTVASIKFKLNDGAVTCNVENINENTNPGSKLTITRIFTTINEFHSTVPKDFLYYSSGSYYMAGIGAYYFGARFYDAELGLWQSTDKLQQFFASYAFTGNGANPVNGVDRDGNYVFMFPVINMSYVIGAAIASFALLAATQYVLSNATSYSSGGMFPSYGTVTSSSSFGGFGGISSGFVGSGGNVEGAYNAALNGKMREYAALQEQIGPLYKAIPSPSPKVSASMAGGMSPMLPPDWYKDPKWVGAKSAAASVMGEIEFGNSSANEQMVKRAVSDAIRRNNPTELVAGAIRNVNPLNGNMNCVNCAAATEATLSGSPASAPLSGPKSISVLGSNWIDVSGPMQIGSILSRNGNGARGIVYGSDPIGNVGHVWNVVNQRGNIRFLDGQIGGLGISNFDDFIDFKFLQTFP